MKKMNKKIKALLTIIIGIIVLIPNNSIAITTIYPENIPGNTIVYIEEEIYKQFGDINTNEKIYDFADLYTDSEEKELYQTANKIIEKYNIDVIILTIDDSHLGTTKQYAENFYDIYAFGLNNTDDGIILVIDMDYREYYIDTVGRGQQIVNVNRLNIILDSMASDMRNGEYYEATNYFLSKVKKYSFSNKYGSPYMWGLAILVALIISYVRLRNEKNKLKLITDNLDASTYFVDKGIENQNDVFSHTTTQVIHHSSSSSGSRSSGGSRHSGGGRRF